eukprot:CAMPEP_0117514892 /NCGR_PEP_ID=MMETSP0784-20121206/30300_1 /TAXON_ID=39447 /ORGANISM="" /LENGTH=290 /DNA_ID=CAMNT_0005310695 /DNA_START=160 /DNA_END=1032 /DNA_ORIENTATION=+
MRALQLIDVEDMEELGFKRGHRRLLQAALLARSNGQTSAAATISTLSEPSLDHRTDPKPVKQKRPMEREPYNFRTRREADPKTDTRLVARKVAAPAAIPAAADTTQCAQAATPERDQKQTQAAVPDVPCKVESAEHCSPPRLVEVGDVIKVEEDEELEENADDSGDPAVEPDTSAAKPDSMPGIRWSESTKCWRIAARRASGKGRIYFAIPVGKFASSANSQEEAIESARQAAITQYNKLLKAGVVKEVLVKTSSASSRSTDAKRVRPSPQKLATSAQTKNDAEQPRYRQ